jgi:hypothetical protein
MHKPILRRVGLVLLLVSLLQLAWTSYLATRSHGFSFDFTFLVAGIGLMFGRLSTARFIRRIAALGLLATALVLVVLVGFAVYWMATETISSTTAALDTLTVEAPEDLVSALIWVMLCAWTFRELGRPEILADKESPVPQEQRATSAARPIRYRRPRAGP